MNEYIDKIWRQYFGEAMDALSEADNRIGAFVAVKSINAVKADANTLSLLGMGQEPDYDEFVFTIERAGLKIDNGESGMKIIMLDTEKDIKAGYIVSNQSALGDKMSEFLPLLSQMQLVKKMNRDKGDSFLALVEIEGMEDVSSDSCFTISAVNAILSVLPENASAAYSAESRLWIYIPEFTGNAEELLSDIRSSVESCSIIDDRGNVISPKHSMTVSAGYSVSNAVPVRRMFMANFALFEARSKGFGEISTFSLESYDKHKNEYEEIRVFAKLVDLNLFMYHFQPIISASTGEIVAYEALMRTDSSIGLNPLSILSLAEKYNRLYDIEKATIKNTLCYLKDNQEAFENRKLFINIISSHILSHGDYELIVEEYGSILNKAVIEMTEQTEISDAALETLQNRLKSNSMELAIDDYGTGYSNASNLIRYDPVYVKIDRSLISHIDTNPKTQKIVSSTIEFLHSGGYIALAEGVETYDELRTLIHMGVDLIQGYYISKPRPMLMNEIAEHLRKEIETINLELKGEIKKVYRPAEGEEVDIYKLVVEKYTDIFIENAHTVLVGGKEQSAHIKVTIRDDIETELVLNNVILESDYSEPAIELGQNSRVDLFCERDNEIRHTGILVPENASLRLCGGGDLAISPDIFDGYAIGCDSAGSYGSITVDMIGKLSINATGEKCFAIGGGRNERNNTIDIRGGDIGIMCGCSTSVGIGSKCGNALINVSDCILNITVSSANAVAIGSLEGVSTIKMSNFAMECRMSGSSLCSIGVLSNGGGSIRITNCNFSGKMNGKELVCIGTKDGSIECSITNTKFILNSEGGIAVGIGDIGGSGNTYISDSEINMRFRSGETAALGSLNGELSLDDVVQKIEIND